MVFLSAASKNSKQCEDVSLNTLLFSVEMSKDAKVAANNCCYITCCPFVFNAFNWKIDAEVLCVLLFS